MIYFAQAVSGGSVKIGHSADVPFRLKQLEAHYGQPLALLATLPGGRKEEREIHERFASARLGRSEQFQPIAEIMAFIGRPLLVGPNPDAVEGMPRRFRTVKIDKYVLGQCKIAAALMKMKLVDYLNMALAEASERDIEQCHRARVAKEGAKAITQEATP